MEPTPPEKSKIRRRSKKDTEGREFICSCGKQYLSYPALYTHNRTKHEGAMPMTEKPKKVKNCNECFSEFQKENPSLQNSFWVLDLLKECLNLRGFQMENEEVTGEYCEVKRPINVPLMANFFLLRFLPYKEKDDEGDLENAKNMVESFCAWLMQKKYTELVIERFRKGDLGK